MRSKKENLEYAVKKAVTKQFRGEGWTVYEDYELGVEEEASQDHDFQVANRLVTPTPKFKQVPLRDAEGRLVKNEGRQVYEVPWEEQDWGVKRVYAPLHHPELLLRLAELGDSNEAGNLTIYKMKDWAEEFGLLGVSDDEGRSESLLEFAIEARRVARTLRLYEAATFPSGPKVKVLENFAIRGRTSRDLNNAALEEVGDTVAGYLRSRSYLVPYRQVSTEVKEIVGFAEGYGFRNLLGAIYILMMWLMKADNTVRRCKRDGCTKIIDFGVPEYYAEDAEDTRINESTGKPYVRGPYKTRSDKVFCSAACKRNWHYHNVEKLANKRS